MSSLRIVTWLWGNKYSDEYVRKWVDGVHRNVKQPHQLSIIRPEARDLPLTQIRGCFCRLRMFEQRWQENFGLAFGERLVCTDLDVVFTGPLDPLFDRPEPFVILAGANAQNPCKFNGSIMMLRGGYNHQVWDEFSLETAAKVPFFEFPDDQGWLWHKLPAAATWDCGKTSGIYSFQKRGWPGNDQLPDGARMVCFPGWRDPSKFTNVEFVREHWA